MTALFSSLTYPIIQAPMAGAQGVAMALAVSQAGGLGSLPAALLSPAALDEALSQLDASGLPYNVNFFCHTPPADDPARMAAWHVRLQPHFERWHTTADAVAAPPLRQPFGPAMAEVLVRHRPAVVSFHFGLPAPDLLRPVKATGAQVWASATTVAEAHWLAAHGADGIVAQGWEAGGHRGLFLSDDLHTQLGTLALVRQVVQAVNLPVVAAGGIADREGVQAVLALGAVAAQVGTAFLCCHEAHTSALHRQALRQPHVTAVTNVLTGRPARGIVNGLMRDFGPINADAPAFPLGAGPLAALRAAAEREGCTDYTPLWAGQNASACDDISAADMVRRLSPYR